MPCEKLLHEAAFLLVERGALLAEKAEFGVSGVEDCSDCSLLCYFGRDANLLPQENDRVENQLFDMDTGAGDTS